MIQLTAILIAIALLVVAASVQVKRRLPRVADWFRRNPMLGCALGILLASSLAWAADTKISALSVTTDFLASKRIPATNVVNTSNEYWEVGAIGGLSRRTITTTDTIIASDRAKVVEATSGTFTLSFTAAATLGDRFWFRVYNSGTGVVTLDPNSTETLDGQTTITLQAGVGRLIYTNGTAFFTAGSSYELVDTQTFTATGAGTWTKHAWARECIVDVIGAGGGGGGGRGRSAGALGLGGSGGGGGARAQKWFLASDLSATESLTVGVGGTSGGGGSAADGVQGGQGGRSEFGTSGSTAKVVAYGGGGGSLGNSTAAARAGGAGGGIIDRGGSGAAAAFVGGHPVDLGVSASGNSGWGGGAAGIGVAGRDATWGGASGGGAVAAGTAGLAGGVSYYGGGGGGVGGGLTAANAESTGGAGGYGGPRNDSAQSGGGTAGGAVNGGAGGTGGTGDNVKSGGGGSGGGSQDSGTGGAGGNGGVPGGGAGGGGAGTTVGGAGGTGGRGEIRVWCFGALDNFFDAGNDPVQLAANDNARWARLEEAA